MVNITLPHDILKKENLASLPAKEKGEYISNVLKKILELNPDGATIAQIREATGYTYSTIWHHLEVLSSTDQCYKLQHGNVDVYSPNLNVRHLNDDIKHDKSKSVYSFSIVENKLGRFVHICKKAENRSGNAAICSGLCIPLNELNKFVSVLAGIKKSHSKEL